MDQSALKSRLDGLANEPDLLRRRLVALGALSALLARHGRVPILVGGSALELYTHGGYTTGDVDLALAHGPEVDRAFELLGFQKRGRFWTRMELGLIFEAPAPEGLPGETAPRLEVDVDGLTVTVIGVEDLLIDRLRAAVHWNSLEDRRWTERLAGLYSERLDWGYLREKTAAEPAERLLLETLVPRP